MDIDDCLSVRCSYHRYGHQTLIAPGGTVDILTANDITETWDLCLAQVCVKSVVTAYVLIAGVVFGRSPKRWVAQFSVS